MYLLQNAYVAQMVMHMCIIYNPIVHLCKSVFFRCVHEAGGRSEAKQMLSVNIKDILQMQVGFNCLLSHKGMLLMLPMTYKGFNRLLCCTSTLYGFMYMLTVKPLSVLTLYGLGDMLDITHVIC